MESYFFNKEVTIDAVYFRNQNGLTGYPKHMVMDGKGITFKSGLQRLQTEGQRIVKLFEMTDGNNEYQLKLDPNARSWQLLRIVQARV